MSASWRNRLLGLGGLAAVAGGLVYLYLFDPNQPGHYPACPTQTLFGVDCPGCGTARALHALVHGDVARAIDHNILLVVTLPVLVGAGRLLGLEPLRPAGRPLLAGADPARLGVLRRRHRVRRRPQPAVGSVHLPGLGRLLALTGT